MRRIIRRKRPGDKWGKMRGNKGKEEERRRTRGDRVHPIHVGKKQLEQERERGTRMDKRRGMGGNEGEKRRERK